MSSRSTFKSCLYCRHRKKACIFPPSPTPDPRCLACQHLGVVCEIAPRQPSVKRQRTSQRISAQVAAQQSRQDGRLAGENADGDCQLAGRREKELLLPTVAVAWDRLEVKVLYEQVVEQDFAFVPAGCFDGQLSPLLVECVRLATRMSFHVSCPGQYDEQLLDLAERAASMELGLADAAGLLLLLSRVILPYQIVGKVIDYMDRSPGNEFIPAAVLAGSMAAQTWLYLLERPVESAHCPIESLLEHAACLDEASFGAHFLKLTHLGARLSGQLRNTHEINGSTIKQWAKIEHASLLNVAEMRSEFLDVRDDMPATPAAVITHMLQNLIYLRLYHYLLCENSSLGEMLALRPIPGVLHFICAITRSTFICQAQILHYWPLVGYVQAVAAKAMLDLWQLTRSENCRALLNIWKPAPGHEQLAQEVRECVGSGPWSVELIDGYSTFWTFRDVRSLCLEILMRQ